MFLKVFIFKLFNLNLLNNLKPQLLKSFKNILSLKFFIFLIIFKFFLKLNLKCWFFLLNMYNIKLKNKILYKIYKVLRDDKKNKNIVCVSFGSDSILGLKILKIIKYLKLINFQHNNLPISERYLHDFISIFNFYKIKLKKTKIEKLQRLLRFKNLKNFCVKNKISNIVTFHNYNDIIEDFILKLYINRNTLKFKNIIYKINKVLKKIKPFIKIKKKYIKMSLLKINFKWFEDESNIKFKNLRNKIRINIIKKIQLVMNV